MSFREFLWRAGLSGPLLLGAGLSGYLVRILYARCLPPKEVGLFYALFDFFMLLSLVRNLGLPQAVVKTLPELEAQGRREEAAGLLRQLSRLLAAESLLLCLILFFLAPSLLRAYLPPESLPRALPAFRALLGAFFLKAPLDLFREALRGLQRYVAYQLVGCLSISLVLLASLGLCLLPGLASVYLPVTAYTLAYLGALSVAWWLLRPSLPRARRNINLPRGFLSSALTLMLGSAGLSVLGFLDGVCLAHLGSLPEVAFYRNAAWPAATILLYPASAFITAIFPYMAKLRAEEKRGELKGTVARAYLTVLALSLPFSLLFALWARPILSLLFGPAYAVAARTFGLLSLGMLPFNASLLGFAILNGLGHLRLSAGLVYLGLLLDLLGNALLIPKLGGLGAAWATVTALFVVSFLQGYVLWQRV